jgi:hypothetical protein
MSSNTSSGENAAVEVEGALRASVKMEWLTVTREPVLGTMWNE